MDWVDKPQKYKGLYGILQLLQGSHLNNFLLKTLKLGWIAYHSVEFQLKCLDFPSNQYKKLAQSSHVSALGYLGDNYLLCNLSLTTDCVLYVQKQQL